MIKIALRISNNNNNNSDKIKIILKNSFMRYGDNNKIEREFLLMALADIDLIMIKAKLSNGQSAARFASLSFKISSQRFKKKIFF